LNLVGYSHDDYQIVDNYQISRRPLHDCV